MCKGINDDGTKCPAKGRYGYKNGSAQYCKTHHLDEMVNLSGYFCPICGKRAAFGYKKGDKILYCGSHALINMKNVLNKMCIKCENVQPTYNYPNEKKPIYCAACALSGMENIKDNKCKKCKKIVATFGYKGGKAEYCSKDKLENMIDITKDYCIEPGCDIGASFNFENVMPYLYCDKHKKSGMVNNKITKCRVCKIVSASYGIDGKKECCAKCKSPDMISCVEQKYCKECNIKTAIYGYENGEKEYCGDHYLTGMINLKHNVCHCGKIATFNFPGEKKPLYCKKDSEYGMIDITAIRCDCGTTAGFGFPGNQPTKCSKDKLPGMIYEPTKKCTEKLEDGKPCKEIAIYGTNRALHCEKHKEPNEYNKIEKECNSCNLITIVNDNGVCGFCDPDMIKTFRLAKQKDVKSLLDINKIKYTLYDKVIDSQCGLERPDFLFDCNTHFVIIEVDEEQHKRNQCDDVRMFNISQTLGMKTIFIRYNPDSFKVKGMKQNVSKLKRHKILLKCLEEMKNKKVEDIDFVSAIYLYYDEYDYTSVHLEKIAPETLNVLPKEQVIKEPVTKITATTETRKQTVKKITEKQKDENEDILIVMPKVTNPDGSTKTITYISKKQVKSKEPVKPTQESSIIEDSDTVTIIPKIKSDKK